MNRVFAQKNKEGEWASIPTFVAAKAFNERGFEVIPYRYEEIDSLVLNREDDFVVGGVSCIRKILKDKFDICPPTLSLPHNDLLPFCNRNFGISTMQEVSSKLVRENFQNKLFVKPLNDHKLFTGHVISQFRDLFKTLHVAGNTEIVWSDVKDFVSEYRIFVINDKIEGMSHYCGDPLIFPRKETITYLVDVAYQTYGLEGFSVDVGVTSAGETLLVELNDGFSLGVYGLNYMIYSRLVEERWKQLMKQ